jgi:hypothetical protein
VSSTVTRGLVFNSKRIPKHYTQKSLIKRQCTAKQPKTAPAGQQVGADHRHCSCNLQQPAADHLAKLWVEAT